MDKKEYLLNEFGINIARENLAKRMRKVLEEKDSKDIKHEIEEIIKDRDAIEKGNKEIIKKYVGEINVE